MDLSKSLPEFSINPDAPKAKNVCRNLSKYHSSMIILILFSFGGHNC
jgi:hypothetical protein